MGKCATCGKDGVSLLYAVHKDLGYVGICQECWRRNFAENRLFSSSGASGGCSCR
ncbi:MAG: hypothetical protein QXI39_03940 [Candidatus Bathyarchaeia archaeon]